MTGESGNLQAVQAIYQAFGSGDVAGILDRLSEEVEWEDFRDNFGERAGVPWLRRGRGKGHVLAFLQEVGGFEMHDFQVTNLLEGGGQVCATIVIDATIPATGKRFRDEEVHIWAFGEDGKVASFRHYVDTAKHIDAARK